MALRLIPLLVLLAVCVSTVAAANSLTLVRAGRPTATLVLAERPTRSAQFAAFELQYHVKLITGAELPIVSETAPVEGPRVLIGESRATHALGLVGQPFGEEEYLIRFLPDTLILLGRDAPDYTSVKYAASDLNAYTTWPPLFSEHATCFAVYDLLERCGVRWFSPDDFGMVYPTRDTLTVTGPDVRRSPAFHYREPGYSNGDGYDNYTRMWQYSGVGGAPKPEESDRLKAVEAMAWAELHKQYPNLGQYNLAKRARTILFLLRVRSGGSEPYNCNHSFYGYYDRFWEKNPRNAGVWEGEHKDWFAQGYDGKPPQMCYTNPGLVQQTVQDARDVFSGKPAKFMAPAAGNYFGIAAMDNRLWCKCANCQAQLNPDELKRAGFNNGWASDYMFGFANQVARELAKTHPDKYVSTIAYASTAYYPQRLTVEPNVSVQLCLHTRNWWSATQKAADLAMLRDWTRDKNRRLFLWLYWCFPRLAARTGNWHAFPGFFAHMAGDQYKLFRDAGIRGMFYEWYGQQTDAYVGFRMMDNPDLDVDDILEDYFTLYYGPAAEPMKQFYLTVEERYTNPANYPPGFGGHQTNEIAWGYLGTRPVMGKLNRLMKQAERSATTEPYKSRVAIFRADIWDYMDSGDDIYAQEAATPRPELTIKKITPAGGDPARVDWGKLTPVSLSRKTGNGQDTGLPVSMLIAHDGQYLYYRLTDLVDPRLLNNSGGIFDGDDWELFWAKDRFGAFRQCGINPGGAYLCYAWNEPERTFDSGAKILSDTSAPDRWVTTVVFPLQNMWPGGFKSGDKVVMNFCRARYSGGPLTTLAWSPTFGGYLMPLRFGDVTFE